MHQAVLRGVKEPRHCGGALRNGVVRGRGLPIERLRARWYLEGLERESHLEVECGASAHDGVTGRSRGERRAGHHLWIQAHGREGHLVHRAGQRAQLDGMLLPISQIEDWDLGRRRRGGGEGPGGRGAGARDGRQHARPLGCGRGGRARRRDGQERMRWEHSECDAALHATCHNFFSVIIFTCRVF